MSFQIAVVGCAAVLCLLNLVLTVGVIKRLREHTLLISTMGGPLGIGVGEEIGNFSVSTMDGQSLSRDLVIDETLIAFFAANCSPCKDKMPRFAEYARTVPGGRDRVLAIMVGEPAELAPWVAMLSSVSQVVVEDDDGVMNKAFKVAAYPTVLRVARDSDGRLVVTANEVDLNHQAGVAA